MEQLVLNMVGAIILALAIFVKEYKKSTRSAEHNERAVILSLVLNAFSAGVFLSNMISVIFF